ncbi:hypothetical protein FOZ62_030172, partial [Perkinsus olseni]
SGRSSPSLMACLSGPRLPSHQLVTSLLRNFASATGGATQKQIINIADWVSQVRQSAQEGVVDRDFWRSVINNIRGPLADKLSVHHCAVLLHALATAGHAEFECMTLLNGRILGELEAMGLNEGEVPEKEEGAAADSGKADSEVALPSSCMSVSDCRLIARASGQSRMYDSQVLDVVAGVLVSRLSELHAGQLVSVLESYGRLPRLRRPMNGEEEEGHQPEAGNVQLLFEVAASVLPEYLPQLQSFQLCAIAQAYAK